MGGAEGFSAVSDTEEQIKHGREADDGEGEAFVAEGAEEFEADLAGVETKGAGEGLGGLRGEGESGGGHGKLLVGAQLSVLSAQLWFFVAG